MLKKTKIVCTMGPNYDNGTELLENVIENGMNVARFNFSLMVTMQNMKNVLIKLKKFPKKWVKLYL